MKLTYSHILCTKMERKKVYLYVSIHYFVWNWIWYKLQQLYRWSSLHVCQNDLLSAVYSMSSIVFVVRCITSFYMYSSYKFNGSKCNAGIPMCSCLRWKYQCCDVCPLQIFLILKVNYMYLWIFSRVLLHHQYPFLEFECFTTDWQRPSYHNFSITLSVFYFEVKDFFKAINSNLSIEIELW